MLNRTGAVIYVGGLPDDIRERELDDLFYKFGRIVSIDLKSPAVPPPFAFVEFDHPRAAADAVIARNGYEFGGARLRVEHAHRGAAGGGFGGGGYGGGYGGPPAYGGGYGGGYGGPPPRGGYGPPPRNPARISSHRCIVSGLPSSTSWQDLKDFFRKSITPEYTDIQRVDRDRVRGIVEFATRDDLKRAIRDLDDTEFSNRFDKAYVRITDDSPRSRSRSPRDRSPRGRSRSRDARSLSRSRSPRRRTLSRSVSRSRSPVRRDDSRSRSRSPVKSVKSVSPARDSPEKMDADKDVADDREKSASPAKSDD